jgi:hypothetical protein
MEKKSSHSLSHRQGMVPALMLSSRRIPQALKHDLSGHITRGEASSKLTLVHSLSNIKESIQLQRKYMEKNEVDISNFLFYHGARAPGKANVASPLHITPSWNEANTVRN